MGFDFDQVTDRRRFASNEGDMRPSDATKWIRYPEDVLPAWVADMDFDCPAPIAAAVAERARQRAFAYADPPPALAEAIVARLQRRHAWTVPTDSVVHLPGVVNGFSTARVLQGSPVMALLCVLLYILPCCVRQRTTVGFSRPRRSRSGARVRRFALSLMSTASAPVLMTAHACSYGVRRTTRRATYSPAPSCMPWPSCACGGICSSVPTKSGSDLLLDGAVHQPIASLDNEVAARTITLMAPSKTFNVPALGYAFAVISDPALRKRFDDLHGGAYPSPNVLGMHGALAAYTDDECKNWLQQLLAYLRANRDVIVTTVHKRWPRAAVTVPAATYLAWLDVRHFSLGDRPAEVVEREARVVLSEGSAFGEPGAGHVRLNFACPRATLTEILDRLGTVLG